MSIAIQRSEECVGTPLFPMRRFTVEEYHRMGEAGVLTEDAQVELLEGLLASCFRKPRRYTKMSATAISRPGRVEPPTDVAWSLNTWGRDAGWWTVTV